MISFVPKTGRTGSTPQLMKARPSESTTMPLQNMSQARVNWVMPPVVGSNSNAPELFDGP